MTSERKPPRNPWASFVSFLVAAIALLILVFVVVLYVSGSASSVMQGENFYGNWPFVILSVLLFALFLTTFLRPWQQRSWREMGVVQAYFVALFTEMFGLPLTIYLLSSAFSARIGLSGDEGHLWATLMASLGLLPLPAGVALVMVLSVALISLGAIVVVLGWRELFSSPGLVTSGVYRWVRHPQYLGFFLIIGGFLIQWPTVITAAMAPILFYAYHRLANKEESDLRQRFGKSYEDYASRVPRFLPRLPRTA